MVLIESVGKRKCRAINGFIALSFLALFHWPAYSKTIKEVQSKFDPQYEKCVSRVLRHPLRHKDSLKTRSPGQFENDSQILDDTDRACRCLSRLEREEKSRSEDQSLAYFFAGRSQYFSQVDSCLLSETSEKNYALFSGIFTYDQIIPLIEVRLKELDPPSVTMVRGRYPAQALRYCMVEKVMEECQKIRSLFFTYKCLKKKMKNIEFYNDIKSHCLGGGEFSIGVDRKI